MTKNAVCNNNNSIKQTKQLENLVKDKSQLPQPQFPQSQLHQSQLHQSMLPQSQLPQKEKLQIIWALSFTFKNIPTSKITELAEHFNYDRNKLFEHCKTEIKDSGFDKLSHVIVTSNPRKCRFCEKRFRNEVMQGMHEKSNHRKRWQRQMQVYSIEVGGSKSEMTRDLKMEIKKGLKRSVEFYVD